MTWRLCGLPFSTSVTRSLRSALRSTNTVVGSGLDAPCKKIYFLFSIEEIFLPPATKLGQGYISTGVCHTVNREGGSGPGGDVCSWGGLVRGGGLLGGGGLVPGGLLGGCLVETPPGRPLLRAVRILLECILVSSRIQHWSFSNEKQRKECNITQIPCC